MRCYCCEGCRRERIYPRRSHCAITDMRKRDCQALQAGMRSSNEHAADAAAATVGVVGAGVMGQGVAQALIATGRRVILIDRSEDILQTALRTIRQRLRAVVIQHTERPTKRPSEVLQQLTATIDFEAF